MKLVSGARVGLKLYANTLTGSGLEENCTMANTIDRITEFVLHYPADDMPQNTRNSAALMLGVASPVRRDE